MDQQPAGVEPLAGEPKQRSHVPRRASMDPAVQEEEPVFTIEERPLMVFEGAMSGEPAWKKLLVILKHYGLVLIGFIFFAIFLGVRINPEDPYTEHQSYTLGVTLMMTCWWLSSAGTNFFYTTRQQDRKHYHLLLFYTNSSPSANGCHCSAPNHLLSTYRSSFFFSYDCAIR